MFLFHVIINLFNAINIFFFYVAVNSICVINNYFYVINDGYCIRTHL